MGLFANIKLKEELELASPSLQVTKILQWKLTETEKEHNT